MGDHDTDGDGSTDAVRAFLREYDRALRDYEKGYVDADATLSRVEAAVDELRESSE